MTTHTSRHIAFQIVIIIVWVVIIVSTFGVRASKSQSPPACGTPDSATPGYLNIPPVGTWPVGTTVHVKIDDDWSPTDRGYIEQGIKKWNGANCSGVTFDDFSAQDFPDPDVFVPDNTIYWIRAEPGGVENGRTFPAFDAQLRTRAATTKIRPSVPNQYSNTYYVYLGTHETGHTWALDDCLCSNRCICEPEKSIMSGQSANNIAFNTGGPKTCDNYA